MNFLIVPILLVTLLSGCATKYLGDLSQDDQRISKNLDTVNFKIWGDYAKSQSTYKNFAEKSYFEQLEKYQSTSPTELRDILKKFETKEFMGFETTYIFCGYSKDLEIAFCDDAANQGVEYFEKANSPDIIKTWQKEFPRKTALPEKATANASEPQEMGFLAASPGLQDTDYMVLDHKYFVVHYDKSYRLARYVAYTVTDDQMKKSIAGIRKNNFKMDPLLLPENRKFAVAVKEYANSGYDKGHLANSKDFSFSREANDTSFLMTNMVPQTENLNQDAWRQLELQVQKWACGEKEVKILTGPILKKNLKTLKSGLAVPEKFFKIVLDETPPKKALAFIYTQADEGNMMAKRQVTFADLKAEVLPQLEPKDRPDFTKYPEEPIATWKSTDCFTKKKSKPTKVVKK